MVNNTTDINKTTNYLLPQIIEMVQQITKKYEAADFKVHLAGSALFSGVIKQAMKKEVCVSMMMLVKVLSPLNNKSFNKGLALASCFLALSVD
jgi:NAD dependent epimerase/dehydratase family enzyme